MRCVSIDWMDNGESVIFSTNEIELNKPVEFNVPVPPFDIYKYNIRTEEKTRLTDHPGTDVALDWISDDILSVDPKGKIRTHWGKLKAFLSTYDKAFKSFSQNLSFFCCLQNRGE